MNNDEYAAFLDVLLVDQGQEDVHLLHGHKVISSLLAQGLITCSFTITPKGKEVFREIVET